MSHCHFMFFPVGQPMRVIDHHPSASEISDLLGGSRPVPLMSPGGMVAAWVRETAATEGQPRNMLATLALHVLGRGGRTPILGPAAITHVAWTMPDPAATSTVPLAVGEPGGFTASVTESIRSMAEDVRLALTGADEGFSVPVLDGAWAASVRAVADALAAVPIPDDYPFCGMPHPVMTPEERVWQGVAAAFGGGRAYVPMPLRT